MKKFFKVALPLILAAVLGIGCRIYYHEFIAWNDMLLLYGSSALILFPFAAICSITGKTKKGKIGGFFGGLVGSAAILFGLTFIFNNVIADGSDPDVAISASLKALVLALAIILIVYLIGNKFSKRSFILPLCTVIPLIIIMVAGGYANYGEMLPTILKWKLIPPNESRYFEKWSADDEYKEDYAIVLEKPQDRDFVILNLTDIQLSDEDYKNGIGAESEAMIKKLIEEQKPDLITVTGDNAWAMMPYIRMVETIDSFGIPWAPVMGNHDGEGTVSELWCAYLFDKAENCLWKFGPKDMGYGNYIINIEENGNVVQTLFMMDTHSNVEFTNEAGETVDSYDHLWDNQIEWYEWAVKGIEKTEGRKTESTLFMHIPVYEYTAVYNENYDKENDKFTGDFAESSSGIMHEAPGGPLFNNNFLDKAVELKSTKNMFFGHEHANNSSVLYNGIRLNYTLKLGKGCYYEEALQGGTVINIDSDGAVDFEHIYCVAE